MKANEVPEKIYIDDFGSELSHDWHIEHCYEKDIEYIRTDAFIEKACEFLYDYNKNMVKKHDSRAVLGCSEFTINVYDFRKYMEGK